jgi:hypothetical protein
MGRGNEKAAGRKTRASSMILHHWWLGEALQADWCPSTGEHQMIYTYWLYIGKIHRYFIYLDSRWRIHGLCTGMVCTWRPLLEKFCILVWQARVGREIERCVREREEEMRKQQGGWQELLVWFYTTGDWGRRCKQTDVPPGVNISWYRHLESRGNISMVRYQWILQTLVGFHRGYVR